MSAWVLILAIANIGTDGGVALHHVPFDTQYACEQAAKEWNREAVFKPAEIGLNHAAPRGKIIAKCHRSGGWEK